MKNKKGISLIVLVITIIIIIILAGSVILSLANNNPIAQATEATFKTGVDAYNSQLNMAISNEYLKDTSFTKNRLNARTWDGVSSTTGTIKEYIPNITDADAKKFEIQMGKLVYVGDITTEQSYMTNMGLNNKIVLGVNTIATVHTTIDGRVPTYQNPIVPAGFKAINDGAVWPTDWNKGLVIEDASGNQFVWVPVDGTNVKYQKWCTTGVSFASVTDDVLPAGVASEMDQIKAFGGFYIARYEAGNASNVLVSKKAATVWTDTGYNIAKTKSEAMYTTATVRSGLITGTQWDTLVDWLQDSGKNVLDSSSWGNFSNATAPANVTGFGVKQVSGFSEFWKANNIYDLAGSVHEWINESSGVNRVLRCGSYDYTGNSRPVAYRTIIDPSHANGNDGFRVALFIL